MSEEELQAMWAEKENKFRIDLEHDIHCGIELMEPDGNCLFRAFSYQIYGDQGFHLLVR